MRRLGFSQFVVIPALMLCFFAITESQAQVEVKISELAVTLQKSPQFDVRATKRWEPKDWLEAEVGLTFTARPPSDDGFLPGDVTVDFYVVLKKDGVILKGSESFRNVPVNETMYASAYLSPTALRKLTGSQRPTLADFQAYAVEVSVGGKIIAFDQKGMPNPQTRPWVQKPPGGDLTKKSRTPFRDLFYDRYLESASE